MAPPSTTRRSILRTGGALAAALGTGSLAGCIEGLGNAGTAGSDRIGGVPATADALFTVDVNTFFADDGVRNTYDAWLETRAELEYYDGPTSLTETLDDFEQREGVDLRDLSRFTTFFPLRGGSIKPDGTGYVLEGGWDTTDALGLVEGYGEFTESTYGDHAIYEPADRSSSLLGVLEEGRYVIGGRDAVHGAIDVERGEAEPIDGPVADAYRDAQAGPVRFATDVRAEWFPEEVDDPETPFDLSALESVETAGGSIYREGNVRGLRVALNAPDASTAEEVETVVDGLLTLASNEADGIHDPSFVDALLEDMQVDRNGPSVAVSVERTVAELEEMATEFGERTTGASVSDSDSGSGQARAPPQATFEWDYDREASTVTVAHLGGDAIDAENLQVTGSNFADVEGADMTDPGPWAGTTTDDGQVAAGSSVTVGVEPDCSLSLVWMGENVSTTMARYEGPEA